MNDRRRPRHFALFLTAASLVLWAPAAFAGGVLTFSLGGHAVVSHAAPAPVRHAHRAHRPRVQSHYVAYAAPQRVVTHYVAYAAPGVVTQSVSYAAPRLETRYVWVSQRPRAYSHSQRAVRRAHRPRGHAHHADCGHSSSRGRRWHH